MLSEKRALVTGASSGIGQAIAVALAAKNAELWLVGRQREPLEAAGRAARSVGATTHLCPADLESEADIRQLAAALDAEDQAMDIVIHSAGLHITGRWSDATPDDFDRQYRVNVRAPYLLTQLLLPGLIGRQGQVVFINSSAGLNARAGVGQYAATKHALKALADSLRDEVNAVGVRVLSVFPGRTAGPMQAALFEAEGRAYDPERLLQPEDIATVVVNALLLPRTAEVTDLHVRPFQKA